MGWFNHQLVQFELEKLFQIFFLEFSRQTEQLCHRGYKKIVFLKVCSGAGAGISSWIVETIGV